jgi:hypothetical protein
MVRRGAFGLRLIDADTDAPLAEHSDDALATWVAGEPDKEYWIELTAEEIAGDATLAVMLVDDKSVGHRQLFHRGDSATRKIGVFKREMPVGEACVHNALVFAPIAPSEGGHEDNLPSYGTVTVQFHAGERTAQPVTNNGQRFDALTGQRGSAPGTKKESIGMLKSGLGGSVKPGGTFDTFQWHTRELLQELTIRYSTRFGLVVRRIVSEPQPARSDESNQMGPLRRARLAARARQLQQSGQAPDAPINLADDDDEAPVADEARPIKRQAVLVD